MVTSRNAFAGNGGSPGPEGRPRSGLRWPGLPGVLLAVLVVAHAPTGLGEEPKPPAAEAPDLAGLEKRAAADEAEAQFRLALAHYQGWPDQPDFEKAFRLWTAAARAGHVEAAYRAGTACDDGLIVERDRDQALKFWEQAAAKGHAEARRKLAERCWAGLGVKRDVAKCLELYLQAAEGGSAEAQFIMGVAHQTGDIRPRSGRTAPELVPKDQKKALAWYLKAAEQGHVDAAWNASVSYGRGLAGEKDQEKFLKYMTKASTPARGQAHRASLHAKDTVEQARAYWETAAAAGDADSMVQFGHYYANFGGWTGPADHQKAFQWFLKAAEKGHLDGIHNVGLCYDRGRGVPKDPRRAQEWYESAARRGHGLAWLMMGFTFRDGVPKDPGRALKCFTQAALLGRPEGAQALNRHFEKGPAETRDPAKAALWFERYIEAFPPNQMVGMGNDYYAGEDVEKSPGKAFLCYLKAAERGHDIGLHNLAWCHEKGVGTKRDLDSAREYYRRAAEQGYANSKQALERLAAPNPKPPPDAPEEF